jgi:hypothetical protein
MHLWWNMTTLQGTWYRPWPGRQSKGEYAISQSGWGNMRGQNHFHRLLTRTPSSTHSKARITSCHYSFWCWMTRYMYSMKVSMHTVLRTRHQPGSQFSQGTCYAVCIPTTVIAITNPNGYTVSVCVTNPNPYI